MKRPNFFVVGAPKCGTTALCQYLGAHPNVFFSPVKEPHYLADEFNTTEIDTPEKYQALFTNAQDSHTRIGEGSTHYLFSPTALKNIYAYNPNAKIIAMLRNPVDLVYSYHSQLLFNLEEDEKDFQKAWSLQSERAKGNHIPPLQKNPMVLQYQALASLGAQVKRLLDIFPPEQVRLIVFDDFKASTASVYKDVLAFLDLPTDHQITFEKVNANRRHRFEMLGRITEKPPQPLVNVVQTLKRAAGIKTLGVNKQLRKVNLQKFDRQPLPVAFRQELFESFRPDIELLSGILSRDLHEWKP